MSMSSFSLTGTTPSFSRKRSSDTPIAANTDGTSTASASMDLSSTKPAAANSCKTRLRVRILKYHGVAKWTWNVGNGSDDEVCGICQSPFEGCPPGVKFPGDESPVVFGVCGHAFHLQCIATWLNSNKQTCPICRADWEYGNSGEQQSSGGNTENAPTAAAAATAGGSGTVTQSGGPTGGPTRSPPYTP